MTETLKENNNTPARGKRLVLIALVYLLGLFIGAIDTGIITPARPIIQSDLGASANLGIWMITIYTLTYAAVIPISGKLADRNGRKPVYMLSIAMFGIGSLICSLSAVEGSFAILMLGRVVQASGAGGIMPVATAEFGTSFPEEKRGMALGLVGAVYGIANVLGASAGSAILDIFGTTQWQWIFLVNVPICIFIVIAGIFVLPNNKADEVLPIDKLGTLLMTMLILSLLYGLKNLDFFDFVNSIQGRDVWPFLVISAVLIPFFVLVERRAVDPIFHMEYMKNKQIVVTLILGIIVGCSLMGLVFIPQFAENAMRMHSGDGGYFVIILGLMAGVSSMGSGHMIDKMGVKPVMALGFIITIIGALYLVFIAANNLNLMNVVVSLLLLGLGLGFTMGTPLNYMMLRNTKDEESNSALATLSLVRSIGTAVAPAIMVGFIIHASAGIQDELMDVLPQEMNMPEMPYSQEISEIVDKYKDNPDFEDQMGDLDIPDVDEMTNMDFSMKDADEDSDVTISEDVLDELQNSDVTTITENTCLLVNDIFTQIKPDIIKDIDDGIDDGIDGIKTGKGKLQDALVEMKEGYDGISKGIEGMSSAVGAQKTAKKQLNTAKTMMTSFTKKKMPKGMKFTDFIPKDVRSKMPADVTSQLEKVQNSDDLQKMIDQIDGALAGMPEGVPGMEETRAQMTAARAQLVSSKKMLTQLESGKVPSNMNFMDFIPAKAKKAMPSKVKKDLSKVRSIKDLQKQINSLASAIKKLNGEIAKAKGSRAEMKNAMDEMKVAVGDMDKLNGYMTAMKDEVPGLMDEACGNYIKAVKKSSTKIENVFQKTVNEGYRQMYTFLIVMNAIGLILLMFYKDVKLETQTRKES